MLAAACAPTPEAENAKATSVMPLLDVPTEAGAEASDAKRTSTAPLPPAKRIKNEIAEPTADDDANSGFQL